MSLRSPLMQQIRKAIQCARGLYDLFEHEPLSGLVSMLAEDLMAVSEEHHKCGMLDTWITIRLMEEIELLLLRLSPAGKVDDPRLQPIKGYLERLKEIKAVQTAEKHSQVDLMKEKSLVS